MANPVQALNENFVYNSLIARSLVPLMPASDRPQLRLWIQKLHEVDGDTDILKIRNEYMWFLLLVLQSNRVTQPFTTDPPKGELQVLKNILAPSVYEDVLMSTEQNMSWLNKVPSGKSGDVTAQSNIPCTPPSLFLQTQPKPKNGITCYMAAFSDHT